MFTTLLGSSIDQRYLPNIQESLSNISKVNTLTKKIIRVAELIILLPWLIIKDSARHLKSCFMKKNFNHKASQNFIAEHSSAILNVALVGGVSLGVIKLRELTGVKIQDQSLSDKLSSSRGAITAIGMAVLSIGAFALHNKKSELDDPFRDVPSLEELESLWKKTEREHRDTIRIKSTKGCFGILLKKYMLSAFDGKFILLKFAYITRKFQLASAKVNMSLKEIIKKPKIATGYWKVEPNIEVVLSDLVKICDEADNLYINSPKKLKPKLLGKLQEFNKEVNSLRRTYWNWVNTPGNN